MSDTNQRGINEVHTVKASAVSDAAWLRKQGFKVRVHERAVRASGYKIAVWAVVIVKNRETT